MGFEKFGVTWHPNINGEGTMGFEVAFKIVNKYHHYKEDHKCESDAVWRHFVYRSQYICLLMERMVYEAIHYTWHENELREFALDLFKNVDCCRYVPDAIMTNRWDIENWLHLPGDPIKTHVQNHWNNIIAESKRQLELALKSSNKYGWKKLC